MLVIAGIDEAGYGPMLGPLVVARSVFGIRDFSPGQPLPDLWKMLQGAVSQSPKESAKLPIADSKKLKKSNHTPLPTEHLERTILACLGALNKPVTTDADLFNALSAQLEAHPWYHTDPTPLPILRAQPSALNRLALDINSLRSALDRAGVMLLDLSAIIIGETEFNNIIRSRGTKAAATSSAICQHMQYLWTSHARSAANLNVAPRVICDRQGGRVDYAPEIASWLPHLNFADQSRTGTLTTLHQSPALCQYACSVLPPEPNAGYMTIELLPEAESHHLPVALASMAAKLTRELLMARFNTYFCNEAKAANIELKPTAGYVQDARRWLSDARNLITPSQRTTMVRIA